MASAVRLRRPALATGLHAPAALGAVRRALPGPRIGRLAIAPRPRERAEALLDRIVRGRAWIPVLAVMLVGIVAMQVEVLKLGASVGRSMNTATELASQIQQERERVSALESPARIERLATGMGLTQPGPMSNHFISAHTRVAKALANISAPDPSAFAARLAAERALDGPATPAAQAAANATDAGTRASALAGAPGSASATASSPVATTSTTTSQSTASPATASPSAASPSAGTSVAPAPAAVPATATATASASAPAPAPTAAAPAATAPASSGGAAVSATGSSLTH